MTTRGTGPVVTTLSPTSGSGDGPIALTLTGTDFPIDPGDCRIDVLDPRDALVGSSPAGTATATEFTASVTFLANTRSGPYRTALVSVSQGLSWPGPVYVKLAAELPENVRGEFGEFKPFPQQKGGPRMWLRGRR
jgi:hypothetical protein